MAKALNKARFVVQGAMIYRETSQCCVQLGPFHRFYTVCKNRGIHLAPVMIISLYGYPYISPESGR